MISLIYREVGTGYSCRIFNIQVNDLSPFTLAGPNP